MPNRIQRASISGIATLFTVLLSAFSPMAHAACDDMALNAGLRSQCIWANGSGAGITNITVTEGTQIVFVGKTFSFAESCYLGETMKIQIGDSVVAFGRLVDTCDIRYTTVLPVGTHYAFSQNLDRGLNSPVLTLTVVANKPTPPTNPTVGIPWLPAVLDLVLE